MPKAKNRVQKYCWPEKPHPNERYVYIYIFLAALGLGCCTGASSSCGELGLLSVAVRGLLIAVASLVVEHGL